MAYHGRLDDEFQGCRGFEMHCYRWIFCAWTVRRAQPKEEQKTSTYIWGETLGDVAMDARGERKHCLISTNLQFSSIYLRVSDPCSN